MELLSGPCHYGQTLTDLFSLALLRLLQKKTLPKSDCLCHIPKFQLRLYDGAVCQNSTQKRFFSQEANIIFPKFIHSVKIIKEVNLFLINSIKCMFPTFMYQIKK